MKVTQPVPSDQEDDMVVIIIILDRHIHIDIGPFQLIDRCIQNDVQ